jgi:hypothetical protein
MRPPPIKTQKTYHGRTGGGWIRRATVCRSLAGDWAVFVAHYRATLAQPVPPIACLDDGYDRIFLPLSPCALRRLTRLEEFAHANTQHDNRYETTTPDGEKRI